MCLSPGVIVISGGALAFVVWAVPALIVWSAPTLIVCATPHFRRASASLFDSTSSASRSCGMTHLDHRPDCYSARPTEDRPKIGSVFLILSDDAGAAGGEQMVTASNIAS